MQLSIVFNTEVAFLVEDALTELYPLSLTDSVLVTRPDKRFHYYARKPAVQTDYELLERGNLVLTMHNFLVRVEELLKQIPSVGEITISVEWRNTRLGLSATYSG